MKNDKKLPIGPYEKQCLSNHRAIFNSYLHTRLPSNNAHLLTQLLTLYDARVSTKNIQRIYGANIKDFFNHLVKGSLDKLGEVDRIL